jgi:hypothetical protein
MINVSWAWAHVSWKSVVVLVGYARVQIYSRLLPRGASIDGSFIAATCTKFLSGLGNKNDDEKALYNTASSIIADESLGIIMG